MISVLIPVFNQSICALARELSTQAQKFPQFLEIIFVDDGSEKAWKAVNRSITLHNKCLYEELDENVGRSKIRNILAAKARGEFLLFLDGDSQIINDQFLQTYLSHIDPNLVLVGGRKFPDGWDDQKKKLHWLAGHYREEKEKSGFQSNNFLISKDLFEALGGFDESVKGYGHEDTLFGYKLEQRGVKIKHINNATQHGDLKESTAFLLDQEQAMRNLQKIASAYPDLSTNLLRVVHRLETLHLTGFVRGLYSMGGSYLRRLLLNHWPNLWLLDMYKIGFYLDLLGDKE